MIDILMMKMKLKNCLAFVYLFAILVIGYSFLCMVSLVEPFYSIKSNKTDNLELVEFKFDPNKDLLVFFHMQKTSGSNLDSILVNNLIYYSQEDNRWLKACEMPWSYPLFKFMRIRADLMREIWFNKRNKFECRRNSSNVNWYLSQHTSK